MEENVRKAAFGLFGTALSASGLALGDIEQIVSIVCSILGLLITITGVIVIPVLRKVKAAKADGKITLDEVQDILDEAKDGVDKIAKK